MTKQIVTLTNDFHTTSVTLRCDVLSHAYGEVTIYPSAAQIKRAKKALCGHADCTCSDDAGIRGHQSHGQNRLIVDTSSLYVA